MEIVATEHDRLHRAAQENLKQILSFTKMTKLGNEILSNCRIFSGAKYDRQELSKNQALN